MFAALRSLLHEIAPGLVRNEVIRGETSRTEMAAPSRDVLSAKREPTPFGHLKSSAQPQPELSAGKKPDRHKDRRAPERPYSILKR